MKPSLWLSISGGIGILLAMMGLPIVVLVLIAASRGDAAYLSAAAALFVIAVVGGGGGVPGSGPARAGPAADLA